MNWRLDDGNGWISPPVGSTPPPARHFCRLKGHAAVYLRMRYTGYLNGTQVAGTGVWSDWTKDFSDLTWGGNASHSGTQIITSTIDLEIAGRIMPVQITVLDQKEKVLGGSISQTIRDPVVMVNGSPMYTWNYNDPGDTWVVRMLTVQIAVPAWG